MTARAGFLALPLLTSLAFGCAARRAASAEPSAIERIDYYSNRIAQSPRLYPMYTQLGLACLDRARETHDPVWLAKAREAEVTALSLQDNFESMMAMAAIQNYAHRFEEAIRWGERAAAASVDGSAERDPAVASMLVEARLGLGQVAEAGRLVPSSVAGTRDFHSASALGRWLAASGRFEEAVTAYARAAAFAREGGAATLAAWAEAAAAAALLDAGRSAEARGHVEAAARLDPGATVVQLRRAEVEQAEGRSAEALNILEALLREDPDPAIEARAYAVARGAGALESAERHFDAAERGLEHAIDAGEVYTLGPLAQLYADAGRYLPRALALARENLKWKRDREALAILAAVQERRR